MSPVPSLFISNSAYTVLVQSPVESVRDFEVEYASRELRPVLSLENLICVADGVTETLSVTEPEIVEVSSLLMTKDHV